MGGVRLWRQEGCGGGGLYTGDELKLEAGAPGRREDDIFSSSPAPPFSPPPPSVP